ncbi:MAG: PIN domain nuclease [Acidobacteria bacterium]|nr:MAG: PIN domain nuclease [Acidobacteriota bacterium]
MKSCASARDTIAFESGPWRDSTRDLNSAGQPLVHATNFMSDKFFVDTNMLVYAHDRAAGVKHKRARSLIESLWDSGGGVLSTQVLQELCVNLRRKTARPLSLEQTRRLLQDYLSWDIVINTADSVIEALANEHRYNILFWDALIIQAAGTSGATVVYSEDLADGQTDGPLRVVNPLNRSSSG